MFLTDKYADVAARYKSWLQMQNVGKYIPDLTLDYLNRAKDAIWGKPVRGWDYLTVDYVPLALGGSTGLEITFPADCGKVLAVYVDNNADHRPDIYYYFAGKIATGMQFISSFDKATNGQDSITRKMLTMRHRRCQKANGIGRSNSASRNALSSKA